MPKIKPSDLEIKNRTTTGLIRKNMEICNVSQIELTVKAMFTRRTLRNKMKSPETFTLRELKKLKYCERGDTYYTLRKLYKAYKNNK